MTEKALIKKLLKYLALRGIFAWRVNCGARKIGKSYVRFNSINGVSDILGVLPVDGRHDEKHGVFLALECKVKPNKPTKEQLFFLEKVNESGGIGAVIYSLDDLIELLQKYEKHPK